METQKSTHYWPNNDSKRHTLQNEFCWCNPIVNRQMNCVIHIAADCREFFNSNDLNELPIYRDTVAFIFFVNATRH